MDKHCSIAGALLILITMTGCDTVSGISAEKTISTTAENPCVIGALQQVPGVRSVHVHMGMTSGWLIMGDGPLHGSPIQYFDYDIGLGFFPTLMIETYGDGRYRFSDTMLALNMKIPRPIMNEALPIMLEAEKEVARTCGVEIETGMEHSCDGSLCSPLAPP